MFRSWWQSAKGDVRLAALARMVNPKKMRNLAHRSNDEQVHLAAARRLQDREWLARLARMAVLNSVRLEAACLIGDQAALTAVALREWDIGRGCIAVSHISNALLLRRVARSALQDAIRLAAALRLKDPGLLKQIARSVTDIQVRWKIAQVLDDPYLMADIAQFKPSNEHMETMRRKARRALTDHLNHRELTQESRALLAFLYGVPYPWFKLEAFVRLPLRDISPDRVQYLSGLDFRYTPPLLLRHLFVRIKAAGWHLAQASRDQICAGCRGNGELLLNCAAGEPGPAMGDRFPCPECHGQGLIPITAVKCFHGAYNDVVFHLPVGVYL